LCILSCVSVPSGFAIGLDGATGISLLHGGIRDPETHAAKAVLERRSWCFFRKPPDRKSRFTKVDGGQRLALGVVWPEDGACKTPRHTDSATSEAAGYCLIQRFADAALRGCLVESESAPVSGKHSVPLATPPGVASGNGQAPDRSGRLALQVSMTEELPTDKRIRIVTGLEQRFPLRFSAGAD